MRTRTVGTDRDHLRHLAHTAHHRGLSVRAIARLLRRSYGTIWRILHEPDNT